MEGTRIVDRDDDTLASTKRMGDYDFVLRMTTRQVSDVFVRDAIESVSVEDRERLKAAVRRPYESKSAYRTAKAVSLDLRRLLNTGTPEQDDELRSCIAELEALAEQAVATAMERLPDDRLAYFRQLRDDMRAASDRGPLKKQKGGGVPPAQVSDMDIRPYRVMQLADAIHDFTGASEGVRQEQLRRDLGVVLPVLNIPIMPRSDTKIRRKMTVADVADKSAFIEAMGMNAKLDFGDGPMDNPLFGLGFEKKCYLHDGKRDESKFAGPSVHGTKEHGEFHSAEMFCYGHGAKETVLRLEKLLEMRDQIDGVFANTRIFVVDQNALPGHPGPDRAPPFVITWMLGFRNTIASLLEYHSVPDKATSMSMFGELYFCDASLHDNARTDLATLSPHGYTGLVHHRDAKVRVAFDGEPTAASYGLVLESDDCPIDIWNPRSKERRLEYDVKISEGDTTRKTATARGATIGLRVSTGKEAMMLLSEDMTNAYAVNCSVALALKNAGDWGQIEHCRQLGAVFVTCDKLAAFYAAYRNVPFMYINHHNYLQSGAKGSFVHYSFVMSDKRVAPPPFVVAPPLAVSRWPAMRGGAAFGLVNVALFAVVVVGALFAKSM
jgi:hypothetical protein